MKENHFYSSKFKSLIMLVSSAFLTYFVISLNRNGYYLFGVIMLNLAFVLFLISFIFSIVLLLRKKPLLTVTDQQIIIYNVLGKRFVLDLEDITSFHTSGMGPGIKAFQHIYIGLRSAKENTKLVNKTFPYFRQSIPVNVLNVNTKVLLELLNTKLRSSNK